MGFNSGLKGLRCHAQREVKAYFYSFFIVDDGWTSPCPAYCIPEKDPWYSMLVGHFRKISSLPGLESRTVQPVAIRNTDYPGPRMAANNDG